MINVSHQTGLAPPTHFTATARLRCKKVHASFGGSAALSAVVLTKAEASCVGGLIDRLFSRWPAKTNAL